ncbi:MAG: DEAD/DEAH box helicase family protein [Verrucomicrobia bacterium]|nr:DEAD/DEAH box helicase family protein [Verrucomicrobiota bacterium]
MSAESNQELLPEGLYEALLDEELETLLNGQPELIGLLQSVDEESTPGAYSQFLWQVLQRAFRITKKENRLDLVNRLIELLAAQDGLEYTLRKRLLSKPKSLLREVKKRSSSAVISIPETPMSISSLLTGSGDDPQLDRELRAEMMTADRVDILVSFIKWSGLRLLLPGFENLIERGVKVRIITTSYMGASDPAAVEWLAGQPNFSIRVSYDTERTRLHAKAYHFYRKSGFSTAYIGSANMSKAAITSGLEWTVKVTVQDMPHMLDRFTAEFESYWERVEFEEYSEKDYSRFRKAIKHGKQSDKSSGFRFFAEITPRPYQERILESLAAARDAGSFRNLVVAATGTGKTVVAALDYARFRKANPLADKLLFVAHRKEILEQARDCFRTVLRDYNFGELLIGQDLPSDWKYVFASVQSFNTKRTWEQVGLNHFDFVVVDEVHHIAANSYRPLLDHLAPRILLGLTATPERMDGSSILPDFDNTFAAEIRLPEALEEKLLCPFHYFGVTDPVAVADDKFWRNGKYDTNALEIIYTGDDFNARQRLDVILHSIRTYFPDTDSIRAVGFCVSVRHAEFMAEKFREIGLSAETVLGETPSEIRQERFKEFKEGRISFLFAVDIFSEGVDIPDINMVLFLRPTESLTVFLQQLGRGLRHAPDKDCLTVLDFVGQSHKKYRIDRKLSALLRTKRRRIDQEIEKDFPNLPPGCSIQFERVAKEYILQSIRNTLGNLNSFVPESIQTFEKETGRPLTFANFIELTDLSPIQLLQNKTWSEWKAVALNHAPIDDPDLRETRQALRRFCLRTDPVFLEKAMRIGKLKVGEDSGEYGMSERDSAALHYLLWGKKGSLVGVNDYYESIEKWLKNKHSQKDLKEVIDWRRKLHPYSTFSIPLPFASDLRLHAQHGIII